MTTALKYSWSNKEMKRKKKTVNKVIYLSLIGLGGEVKWVILKSCLTVEKIIENSKQIE